MPLAQHTLIFTTAGWLLAPPAVSALHAQPTASEAHMKKKQQPKFIPVRDYKFDTAMQDAAKKARAFQPKLITATTKVPEFQKL
jgi:hypothetical protein